jgi:hypothetical protein
VRLLGYLRQYHVALTEKTHEFIIGFSRAPDFLFSQHVIIVPLSCSLVVLRINIVLDWTEVVLWATGEEWADSIIPHLVPICFAVTHDNKIGD